MPDTTVIFLSSKYCDIDDLHVLPRPTSPMVLLPHLHHLAV